MNPVKNNKVIAELKRIAARNAGGILDPAEVVAAARPKSSPLHSRFEWDNTKAGEQYRLWQARTLIRVCVQVMPTPTNEKHVERVWVSLKEDRKDDGGYRPLVAVLSDAQLCEQLIADALSDLEVWEEKYKNLKALSEVFRAIKKVRLQHAPKAELRA